MSRTPLFVALLAAVAMASSSALGLEAAPERALGSEAAQERALDTSTTTDAERHRSADAAERTSSPAGDAATTPATAPGDAPAVVATSAASTGSGTRGGSPRGATTTTTVGPTPDVPATPAGPVPCGGTAIAKPGGGHWECTFEDDFDASGLDPTKWVVQKTATSGFHSGPECFVDTPNNIAAGGGVLRLTVREEPQSFDCTGGGYTTKYTSGMVSTWSKFSQAFGRFEVRAKISGTTKPGLQTSIWMWPDSQGYGPWPISGEIDIVELYSQWSYLGIPYIHYWPVGSDPNVTSYSCVIGDPGQYHTYTLEWTRDALTILFDGKVCLVDRWNPMPPLVKPQPFDKPFSLSITQALGLGTNSVTPETPLPASTVVDYVRIWK